MGNLTNVAAQRVQLLPIAAKSQQHVSKQCGPTEKDNIGTKKDPIWGFMPKSGDSKECSQAKANYNKDAAIPMHSVDKFLNSPIKKFDYEN